MSEPDLKTLIRESGKTYRGIQGVHYTTVARIANGQQIPSNETIRALADSLGQDPQDIGIAVLRSRQAAGFFY